MRRRGYIEDFTVWALGLLLIACILFASCEVAPLYCHNGENEVNRVRLFSGGKPVAEYRAVKVRTVEGGLVLWQAGDRKDGGTFLSGTISVEPTR